MLKEGSWKNEHAWTQIHIHTIHSVQKNGHKESQRYIKNARTSIKRAEQGRRSIKDYQRQRPTISSSRLLEMTRAAQSIELALALMSSARSSLFCSKSSWRFAHHRDHPFKMSEPPGFCSIPRNTVEQDHQKAQCHKEAPKVNLENQDSRWLRHVVLPSADAQICRSVGLWCCPCWELWSQPWKSHEFRAPQTQLQCDSVYGIFCDRNIALHELHEHRLLASGRAETHRLPAVIICSASEAECREHGLLWQLKAGAMSCPYRNHPVVSRTAQRCSKMLSKYHQRLTASLQCTKLPGRGWCLQATCSTCDRRYMCMCDCCNWSFA